MDTNDNHKLKQNHNKVAQKALRNPVSPPAGIYSKVFVGLLFLAGLVGLELWVWAFGSLALLFWTSAFASLKQPLKRGRLTGVFVLTHFGPAFISCVILLWCLVGFLAGLVGIAFRQAGANSFLCFPLMGVVVSCLFRPIFIIEKKR